MAVAAVDGHYGRHHAFGFHPVEAVAHLVHPVDARLFHKTDVVAVVGDAHSVAFIVFHLVPVGFDVHIFLCKFLLINDYNAWIGPFPSV